MGRLVIAHAGAEARAAAFTGQWGVTDGAYSQGYDYDWWGNLTRRYGWGGEVLGGNPPSSSDRYYTYSNNHRTNPGFEYDLAGNLTFDGGQRFAYDAEGRQVSSDWTNLQQGYDGDSLRVRKSDDGTSAVYYLRSSVLGGRVVAEMSSSGGWQRGYVYVGSQLLAVQQGGVFLVHEEPVTKAKRVTDVTGAVVSAVEVDPFGADTARSGNSAFQPRKFTTYERDMNGTDDAMWRRYNRWHARFDQPDPYEGSYDLSDPQSLNRYAYTQNDPVNFIDPTGLQGDALNQGITEARNALQGSACRSLFRGKNAVDLLNTYVANGLIEVNSRPKVPGRQNERGRFRDANVGAATSAATATLITPSGVRQSAHTITINQNGFFFSLRTANGRDVRTAPEFHGLSDAQVRGAVIVHELAHVAGVILSDGHDPAQSQRNSMLVKLFCFSSSNNTNAPLSTPATLPNTIITPRPIGGGGGGGRFGGGGAALVVSMRSAGSI